jgi:ferredoxin-NADP reductase
MQEISRRVRVERIRTEAEGVKSFVLAPVEGDESLPEWAPGAHIDVIMGNGLERQYSLCGDPADAEYRIAVLREPASRGGSEWMHEELAEHDELTIRGPRNHFPLVEAPEYLFIGGGIGITPLIPMIRQAAAQGSRWRLVYGGRQLSSMAFTDELGARGEGVVLWPQDQKGIIDLPDLLGTVREDVAVYTCGPEVLLAAVEEKCESWPEGSLHLERFKPRPGALEGDGENGSFDIELELSGMTLTVGADESIVDVVTAAGIDVPTSCREGTCGTCETVVLGGVPDHRDSFLTPQERESNEIMMVCCSRSRTPKLVLEL